MTIQANDTSMRVRAACYDCGEDLGDWGLSVNRLAEMTTPPRCGKHARLETLNIRCRELRDVLDSEDVDDTTRLLARVALDTVIAQRAEVRA